MNFKFFGENTINKEPKNITEIIKDGSIEIIDIKPEQETIEMPIMVAPGWGNTPQNFKKSLEILAGNDQRVLSVGHSRKDHGIKEAAALDDKKVDLEEVHKALVILSTLAKKDIDKVNAVGYSEGGINLLLAAKYNPERFKNIVLVEPAGMIGKDNIFSLAKRFSHEIIQGNADFIKKPETRMPIAIFMREIAKYIGKNPLKTFREVKAISESDIKDILKELKEEGIGVSMIHGVDDKVFPMQMVQNNISSDYVDGFYSVIGGHIEIFVHPEKIMPLVKKAFADLENKKKNK